MQKEEDIPTGTEGPKTKQYDSNDSSYIFLSPGTERDL